jgi:hypothetical protein
MFRDRILRWSHLLNPFTEHRTGLRNLLKERTFAHAICFDKQVNIDEYRAQLHLDVSRAYIKLSQTAR